MELFYPTVFASLILSSPLYLRLPAMVKNMGVFPSPFLRKRQCVALYCFFARWPDEAILFHFSIALDFFHRCSTRIATGHPRRTRWPCFFSLKRSSFPDPIGVIVTARPPRYISFPQRISSSLLSLPESRTLSSMIAAFRDSLFRCVSLFGPSAAVALARCCYKWGNTPSTVVFTPR